MIDLSPFSLQGQDLADPNASFMGTGDGTMDKQKMLAKMLMGGFGSQKPSTPDTVNGWAVKKPLDFGSLLGGLASGYMMGR